MIKFIKAVLSYGPWYCPICGASYNTDAEGAAHMASAHPGY
jgi:hypothetical protein